MSQDELSHLQVGDKVSHSNDARPYEVIRTGEKYFVIIGLLGELEIHDYQNWHVH